MDLVLHNQYSIYSMVSMYQVTVLEVKMLYTALGQRYVCLLLIFLIWNVHMIVHSYHIVHAVVVCV
jgi:hypothetical protein